MNVQAGAKLVDSHRAISKCICAGYNLFVFLWLRIICITIRSLQLSGVVAQLEDEAKITKH